MKVVDFLKRKREILAQHPFELKDWLSPAIRDYWREFQQRHIFTLCWGVCWTCKPSPRTSSNRMQQPWHK